MASKVFPVPGEWVKDSAGDSKAGENAQLHSGNDGDRTANGPTVEIQDKKNVVSPKPRERAHEKAAPIDEGKAGLEDDQPEAENVKPVVGGDTKNQENRENSHQRDEGVEEVTNAEESIENDTQPEVEKVKPVANDNTANHEIREISQPEDKDKKEIANAEESIEKDDEPEAEKVKPVTNDGVTDHENREISQPKDKDKKKIANAEESIEKDDQPETEKVKPVANDGVTDHQNREVSKPEDEGKKEIANDEASVLKDDDAPKGEDDASVKSKVQDGQPTDNQLAKPFEKFDGAVINKDGNVVLDDKPIGHVIEGEAKDLVGNKVDAEGNIVDESGAIVGKADLKDELKEDLAKEDEDPVDSSIDGAKVNKAGNLVNDNGQVVGRVTEGILKDLVGKKADSRGRLWDGYGNVIGKAEPIPMAQRQDYKEPAPFEDFPDAIVHSDGKIMYNGEAIGIVVEGDPKKLKGKKVDEDGEILDRAGNVIGKATRWEEEEAPPAEPEPEPDRSSLAGKRVNKAGNLVDASGQIYGRIIEGDAKRLVGRMCDKDGNIRSEAGDIIGKAEVVTESEREGSKDGPFTDLQGCTVTREGKVVTPGGDVIGRLTSGDAKILAGRPVDDDGDILDRNGNVVGKAERWEEPEVEKKKGPMAGRRVNREGNVVDEDGNLVGKLTTGEISICGGKEIDDDGDVIDSKGRVVGHASLLADIPPVPSEPAPTESAEDKKKREEAERDSKLAKQLTACVQQCLDSIAPILKRITNTIDKAERTPKDELDEEQLVKDVRPLIEDGSKILNEANGAVRGLDPDGRIQANAKFKAATTEATPEEFHLADVLKELTGNVTECIDNAKRKIEGMPHAKKELSPLWGLLAEPLFQILAAVGLLLSGVLGLVGKLLSALGLGGLVDNLLGGLGLTRLLEKLGVGSLVGAITGKKKK